MNNFEVDRDECVNRFLALTAIKGRSGQEKDVATAIVDQLLAAGIAPENVAFDGAEERTRIDGNCGNLIVKLPGNGSGPTTLLSAHMDTVPICEGCEPVIEGDEVTSSAATGLGADNRSGCSSILTAAIERQRRGDSQFDPAVLLFTVQEEIGLQGARHLDINLLGKVDRAFNFDGGRLAKITDGAIGGERIDIQLTGMASHAGVSPETGVSAIVIAAKAIAQLERDGWLGQIQKPAGSGTANVGVIHGGEATNVVTPQVVLRAEARSHDAAMRTEIVRQMKLAFDSAAAAVKNVNGQAGQCQFVSHVDYESFCLPEDDPTVNALELALEQMGRKPFREVAGGGLDANWLNEFGIPTPTIGSGQMNIHTAEERLNIEDYLGACQLATMLICGGA